MELPDIVSLGKPASIDWPDLRPWPLEIPFGKYELVMRLPSGGDDECYIARSMGISGFEKPLFIRRFAEPRIEGGVRDALIKQAYIRSEHVTQVFELGRIDDWWFVGSEYIPGASLAELPRIPWLVALALVHDVCTRVAELRLTRVGKEKQFETPDLAITPARIKLGPRGLTLCMGRPKQARPPWHETVCALAHPILALAATTEERALLAELFADDNPDAIWVVSDALVQRHPELDPALPIVFLALAGRVDRVAAHAALVERVPIEQLRELWNIAIDVVRRRPVG